MHLTDEIGNRYGRLLVIGRAENCKQGQARWRCRCDCGKECVVTGSNLRRGKQVSCGCYGHSVRSSNDVPTELRQGRIYRIWQRMIYRCTNPNNNRYAFYGGRGIKICDEWLNDFKVFYEWAIDNGYADDLSIDRINVDGNYEPSNCRWATAKEQARNTSRTRYLTIAGETKPLMEWCEIYRVSHKSANTRISRGWTNPYEILFGRQKGVLENGTA